MSDLTIEFEEHATGARYIGKMSGHDDARLTYSRSSPELVIADSTIVPDSMRGMGVGKKLVDRLISDAREKGFKIVPLCPFVKAQFARNKDWADVLAG